MRSRREEYTKRFEETTKQEIKTYNDSLLNTHVALEDFRRKLKDCVDLYAGQVAQLSSQIKKVESENNKLKLQVCSMDKALQSQVHDFNNLERDKIEGDRKRDQFQDWVKNEVGHQYNSINQLEVVIRDFSLVINRRVSDTFKDVAHSYRKSQSDNKKLKEEIFAIPSEAEKVKGDLLKKISESAVDNAGIQRELEKIKKKSVIQESMNEYFHIQLDRIKKTIE